MPTITIEIPKKILQRGTARRLIEVDPKEFEKELWRRWDKGGAEKGIRDADDVLTPKEKMLVRKGEQQLRQGKSKAWQKIKHDMAL